MAQKSYFFNSAPDDPRTYQAADFARYFGSVLTSGIMPNPETGDFWALTPGEYGLNTRMYAASVLGLQVVMGNAIIRGYRYELDSPHDITFNPVVSGASGYDRIDRIVLRLDLSSRKRNIELKVIEGDLAANPVPPALTRNNTVFELSLARVRVRFGYSYIVESDVVDERADETVCGFANSLITVPTSVFQQQFDAWFGSYKNENEGAAEAWLLEFKEQAEKDADAFAVWLNNKQTTTSNAIDAWQVQEQREYDAWLAGLQERYDGAVAENIELEVIDARGEANNLRERLDDISSLSLDTQSRLTSNVKTRPLITFIDDDGGKQVYTKLKPIFEARGVPCTIALLSSHVQTGTTLTLNQAKELQDVLGWEIASHGHAQVQLNDLTEEQVITQLTVSKNYFSRNGINAENYVYGFGYPNAKTRDLVRRYYQCGVDSQLNENGGINKVPLAQYKIARVGLGSFDGDRTLDDYKAFIDRAITESGWVIFMLHVDGTDEQGLQDLADTIDYAISKNVDIVNLNDALEVFGNNIFVGDYAGNLQNDKYHIVAKSGETYTNNMPKTSITIDTPITHFSFGQTIKHFISRDNTSFPGETGGSGTLITNRAQQEISGDDSLSTQIFIPFGKNEFYMRHAEYGGAAKWSEFTRITNEDINPIINRYTSTTPPSSFPLWETTTFYYNATGQGAFPVSAGVVTTYRIQNATDKAFTYQMLKSYVGNRLFLRTAKDDDTWQAWSEIDSPDITPTRNAYSNATPPSGFPDLRVTIFYFNSGGSQGFPTTAGVVHTYIIKDSYDKGYSYQELKVYKQNVKYTRYELSDDKWSEWELVGSVSPTNP